jgi:UrcA family protein
MYRIDWNQHGWIESKVNDNCAASNEGDCLMTNFPCTRLNAHTLCRSLPIALAVGGLAFASARAYAVDADSLNPVQLDPITVIAPSVKIVGRDASTGAPIEKLTFSAEVRADPAALRTEYGALMLEYSVRDAARNLCNKADPFTVDDGTCYQKTVQSTQPQVDAAIARARSNVKS